MTITLHDRAPLEKVRRLSDGRVAAVAKFARSGCLTYAGAEVGRPDLQTVTVYRPEDEVFSADAMASFAHKAITLGHPAGSVTADNWSTHAKGWTEGKVARDGEFIEIPLMLADKTLVEAFDAGTRELSAGYECELEWGRVTTPGGEIADATQRRIRGNHIAVVATGRAGPVCRIGDARMAQPEEPKSIDEAVQMAIASKAEAAGKKPSEYLATLSTNELEKLTSEATTRYLQTAGGQGISKVLGLDAADAFRAATGRPSIAVSDQVLAIQDQVARDYEAKRQRDNASVEAQIAALRPPPVHVDHSNRAIRDAARAADTEPDPLPSDGGTTGIGDAMAADGAAMRDLARVNHYR